MKKKIALSFIIALGLDIALFFVSTRLAIIGLLLLLFCLSIFGALYVLNEVYRHTNHYKNKYLFKNKFVSGLGYREDLSRNYDIVNLGSNPAYYGFFYDNVRGQNWSTGSQGLDMDFEILKNYHSYIKRNGFVLIPIMPFTATSQYLKQKKQYWGDEYYSKFVRVLDLSQVRKLPNNRILTKAVRYPLIFNPKLVKYIVIDDPIDNKLQVSEQTMNKLELERDADRMMKMWLEEFDAQSLTDFLGNKYDQYVKEGQEILDEIIDFCKEREYIPVLITVPMSSELSKRFSEEFHQEMIIDFVDGLTNKDVKFLDYFIDETFQDDDLFNGSMCFNLRGRKRFTNQVVRDLNV